MVTCNIMVMISYMLFPVFEFLYKLVLSIKYLRFVVIHPIALNVILNMPCMLNVYLSLMLYVATNILCAYHHLAHCGLGKHICFHALDNF